jgi:TolB-like protein
MPFVGRSESAVAAGLTEDVITRLAKLRVLFVIARGTVYALRDRGIDAQEAGRILGVEYVVSGSIREDADRVCVVVELAETESARLVWTEELAGATDETLSVLDAIVDRIVASIAEEIETAECNRAILKAPSSLDAWEAYHRGLWHMYKFNGLDNRHAADLFRDSLRLDPTFSRAYAGLSFTHFQNAFLGLTPDRTGEIDLAFDAARRSVEADARDPAAHWAMGRALWLRGDERDSFAELEQSIELSPNFALGHYTLGFVHSQTGDPRSAIDATDHSRRLSPFDPLQFAMLASRALAHIRLGEIAEAAEWAVKATGRPNAHVHILAIAVQSLVLAKRHDEARKFVARIRARAPAYTMEDFLRAFRFDADTTTLLRQAAKQIGFDTSAR